MTSSETASTVPNLEATRGLMGSAVHASEDAGGPLSLRTREVHEARVAARARQEDEAERPLYRLRAGIEGTLSQGVRAFGLRRARYRGLAKTHLQTVITAVALNLDRLAAWLDGRPLAPTRKSRFAALAA